MFRRQVLENPHSLINFTILKKVTDVQLILLYLKFESNTINFQTFSSQYKISYDSYQNILKALEKQQIVKEVNKNSKFKTYKLIKQNVEIFPNASKSDEELVYQYLHSSSSTPQADTNSYIQIVLYPNALKILKDIKEKYNSKPFKKSSVIDNNSTTTKQRAFKFLMDHNAIRKFAAQTYVSAEFYDQALQQAKLKKNPPIINYEDLNSVIKDTKWSKYCNIHDLEISADFKGLYNDLINSNRYDSTGDRIIYLKNELIYNTHVTVLVYPKTTIIMIRCSEKPILANDLLRFNRILAEIIGHINNNPFIKEYDYDYHNFSVVKYNFSSRW